MTVACDTITWIDADGADLVLAKAADRDVLQGVTGRGMPPIIVRDEPVPEQAGARLRYVQHGARDYAVPWMLSHRSLAELNALLRATLPRFDPLRGDGTLRLVTPDGQTRDLTCRYISGAERIQASPNQGVSEGEALAHQVLPLVFRAWTPYWLGPEVSDDFTAQATLATFFPIPNATTGSFVTLTSSVLFAAVQLTNDGDVDAQPIWTITGPASNIAILNADTGQTLEFTGLTLAGGEVATIDTREYVMTAELADGTNLYPYLTDASEFWWLPRGTTNAQLQLSGTDANSLVSVAWRPRYITV